MSSPTATPIPVYQSVDRLLAADMYELRNFDWLCQHIASWGLQQGPGARYGEQWSPHVRESGIWQQPEQLARLLLLASERGVRSYCEVGVWRGYCLALVATYLYRFSRDFRAVGVDVAPALCVEDRWDEVQKLVPVEIRTCDSSSIKGEPFDLVFVDGDHRYDAVRRDWENLNTARLCAFHDCNCDYVRRGNACGGVPRFWQELRASTNRPTVEFFDSPTGLPWMGIGVVLS